jgi:hypothetical protein
MMELMTGEAGVLRTALGVVLAREGIDLRVRVYLWSGGVEDVVLPTMNAQPYPVGAQVIVQFLSDKTASGMVLGAIEGLLSWRRVEAPAFTERMQPHLQETAAKCAELDPVLTVVENVFTLDPDEGQGLFSGAIAMPDGRVFFVPGQTGAGTAVIAPTIWDPYSGALHEVAVSWEAGSAMEFIGACLLQDGRVFFSPSWASSAAQAYIYDPELDRVVPAGEAVVSGYNSCVLMADGRVLLVPWSATGPLIYDPRADSMTVSAASTPAELQMGADYASGVLLGDGRVLLVPMQAAKPLIYDPAADSLSVVVADLGGQYFEGGVLLRDGRVLLVGSFGTVQTVIFDPATDSCTVATAATGGAGGWRGGALLADGRVLLLPGTYSDLPDCRIFDPGDGSYDLAPELSSLAAAGLGMYAGGCVLPNGRVVFVPWYARHLVVWEPGLGAAYGRDIALAAFWNHRP